MENAGDTTDTVSNNDSLSDNISNRNNSSYTSDEEDQESGEDFNVEDIYRGDCTKLLFVQFSHPNSNEERAVKAESICHLGRLRLTVLDEEYVATVTEHEPNALDFYDRVCLPVDWHDYATDSFKKAVTYKHLVEDRIVDHIGRNGLFYDSSLHVYDFRISMYLSIHSMLPHWYVPDANQVLGNRLHDRSTEE